MTQSTSKTCIIYINLHKRGRFFILTTYTNSHASPERCHLMYLAFIVSQPYNYHFYCKIHKQEFMIQPINYTYAQFNHIEQYSYSFSISIEHGIINARKAFFAYGSIGAFQGKLNPLSGRAILNTCVIPTCLSGCENWILNDNLLKQLEDFQAQIGKKILR